jgi:hypothetical protein
VEGDGRFPATYHFHESLFFPSPVERSALERVVYANGIDQRIPKPYPACHGPCIFRLVSVRKVIVKSIFLTAAAGAALSPLL